MHFLYLIRNNVTSKYYVGQTRNIEKRKKCHFSPPRIKEKYRPLPLAVRKYGPDAFDFFVIAETDSSVEIDELETFWIAALLTTNRKFGYNLDSGGCKNKTLSLVTRDKISVSMKRQYSDDRAGIWRDKTLSAEHRKKISESCKVRIAHKQSAETRAKLAEVQRKRWKKFREQIMSE